MTFRPYRTLCSLFYDAVEGYAPACEVNFYAEHIDQAPGLVLEAMSGSGRLQIPLMRRGYRVDGVDSSEPMLARCRQRSAQFGLQPTLYQQSLECLSLENMYTAVIIPFGSFQLITDKMVALQALRCVRKHMQSGSVLLIDLFVPDDCVEPCATQVARIDADTTIHLAIRREFCHRTQQARAWCTYTLMVDDLPAQVEQELEVVTWYTDDEFKGMLEQAGFVQTAFYDESFRRGSRSHIVKAVVK